MKKISKALFLLISVLLGCIVLTIVFWLLHQSTGLDVFVSLYVTFLTISYHFAMRLFVGETVTLIYNHREFNHNSFWFRPRRFEAGLYKLLRVKKWKLKMITAKPEQFDMRKRSVEELLHNIAQAEIVHEIIIVLSFAPLALIPMYGVPGVFIGTSIGAAILDCIFVIIQRYNRPRVMKIFSR